MIAYPPLRQSVAPGFVVAIASLTFGDRYERLLSSSSHIDILLDIRNGIDLQDVTTAVHCTCGNLASFTQPLSTQFRCSVKNLV